MGVTSRVRPYSPRSRARRPWPGAAKSGRASSGRAGQLHDRLQRRDFDVSTTEVTMNLGFETWMMYRPPGTGSVFVPIKNIEWNCAGDGVEDPLIGWYIASSDSGWDFLDDFPAFPAWTAAITASEQWYP